MIAAPQAEPADAVLLPYQGRWIASGLGKGWKLRIAEKSRRVGITWAEAYRQALLAASPEGCTCYYVSTSQALGRDYIEVVSMWARAMEKIHPGKIIESIGVEVVKFKSGHKVMAVTSSPRALRGKGGDVVVDEAAHHVDLEAMLKAAFAVGKWTPYGLTLISTHNGSDNLFSRYIEEIRAGQRRGIVHRVDLESAVKDGLYRRICAMSRTPWSEEAEREWIADAYLEPGSDEEYKVNPSKGSGVYFRRDLLERQSIDCPVLHWDPGEDYLHDEEREATTAQWCIDHIDPLALEWPELPLYVGVDFARVADLSSFAIVVERADLRREVVAVVELRKVPYQDQWTVLRWIYDAIGHRLGGAQLDGGGNGGWLAEESVAYLGPEVAEGVHQGQEWKQRHFGRCRKLLEEGLLWVPRDLDTWGDFGLIELAAGGRPEVPKKKRTKSTRDGGQRHGDNANAIIAAVAATVDPPDMSVTEVDDFGEDASEWPDVVKAGVL